MINYDLPSQAEDYVHRIGRTGRAGAMGMSYSMFTNKNAPLASELVKLLRTSGQKVPDELQQIANNKRGHHREKKFQRYSTPSNRSNYGGGYNQGSYGQSSYGGGYGASNGGYGASNGGYGASNGGYSNGNTNGGSYGNGAANGGAWGNSGATNGGYNKPSYDQGQAAGYRENRFEEVKNDYNQSSKTRDERPVASNTDYKNYF